MLPHVGAVVAPSLPGSAAGASTANFNRATRAAMAPLSGLGYFRIGEDGRLYLATKSEHYHASLGHGFPGYALVDIAKRLGIPNATHNNTAGTSRAAWRGLVAAAMVSRRTTATMGLVLASDRLDVLNRVLNLETGSLAVEAAHENDPRALLPHAVRARGATTRENARGAHHGRCRWQGRGNYHGRRS